MACRRNNKEKESRKCYWHKGEYAFGHYHWMLSVDDGYTVIDCGDEVDGNIEGASVTFYPEADYKWAVMHYLQLIGRQ
jgi:elongation factor P hydroxylase